MGQAWVHPLAKPVIDWDRATATVSVPASGAETSIVTQAAKFGKQGYIVAAKQAWDASIDGTVQWALFIDSQIYYKFPYSTVQWASPGSETKFPVRIAINQGASVEIRAFSTIKGNVTATIELEYEDF